MKSLHQCGAAIVLLSFVFSAAAQPAQSTTDTSNAGIDHLRDAIKSAYEKGDVEGMLKYIHPDAAIIFPDGRILKGPDDLRNYYTEMLKSPDHLVSSYSSDPIVQSRTVHGDVGLSYGLMKDNYVLTNGAKFGLDSRFTVTVFKSANGPADTDGWMIRSFHSSSNVFDNDVLRLVKTKMAWTCGGGGLIVGLVVGAVAMRLVGRNRNRTSQAAT
jgi:ketosteroid isomerase-like protein